MFDPEAGENGEWNLIGTMRKKRTHHAISAINFNEIKDYCV